ncbi:MAG: carboxypeptidase-like regulatory domain-containing protein, partial [Bacillota bacterium]
MKNSFIKRITTGSLLTALLLLSQSFIFAQAQRGKITGRVVDDLTNEPLAGTTVLVQGTHLGAGVDVEGKFFILNVPVGKYTLTASMMGYATVNLSNVDVNIDRTTQVTFRLKDKSIQTSTVEIVADRPKVIKDQTASSSTLSEETIKAAPVEGLRGVIDLSTAFQKDTKGDYQVRGSGTNEISFQINGVEQSNSNNAVPGWGTGTKANNSWKYDVNPIGVQQMQMITGGFNAEYGNAQAGVIKVVMKEG